jgi:heme exporter protein A
MSEHKAHLQVAQLAFERNQQLLFSNIHFTLHAGQVLQLRGENGAGKSTLLRILGAFLEPVAGDICWDKKSVLQNAHAYQESLHYLGHHNGLKANLTIRENCELYASIAALSGSPDTVLQQLALLHLADKPVKLLSAGQARRAALARLMLDPRALWLLDEPMTGLDESGRAILFAALLKHLSHGGMAIIATHYELDLHCDMQTLQLRGAHA